VGACNRMWCLWPSLPGLFVPCEVWSGRQEVAGLRPHEKWVCQLHRPERGKDIRNPGPFVGHFTALAFPSGHR
jgi:hypothetical protein